MHMCDPLNPVLALILCAHACLLLWGLLSVSDSSSRISESNSQLREIAVLLAKILGFLPVLGHVLLLWAGGFLEWDEGSSCSCS